MRRQHTLTPKSTLLPQCSNVRSPTYFFSRHVEFRLCWLASGVYEGLGRMGISCLHSVRFFGLYIRIDQIIKVSFINNINMELSVERLRYLWQRWDVAVTKSILDMFENAGWEQIREPSPYTRDLPLVRRPTSVVTAIVAYLTIILSSVFLMSTRGSKQADAKQKKQDPAWLKAFMFFHNIFLVVLSTYMFVETILEAKR